MSPLARALALPVRLYRWLWSPWVGHNCRYLPTCSAYALEALEAHGAWRGGWLALRRVLRCHPLGGSGYDPAPTPPSVAPPSAAPDAPSAATPATRRDTGAP